MDEKKLKLMKLLEHWVKHNEEHGERFREASTEAEKMGLINSSKELKKAYLKTMAVSNHLRNALSQIEENSG